MSTVTIGRRPTEPRLVDAPVVGQAVALVIKVLGTPHGEHTATVALLGPGRDYADRTDAREAAQEMNATGVIRVTVSEVFDTMSDLIAEFPQAEANLTGTARRLLLAERGRVDHAAAVAAWVEALAAIGHEPCDRCGGAGGYAGWPGFTCYQCDGHGHTHA